MLSSLRGAARWLAPVVAGFLTVPLSAGGPGDGPKPQRADVLVYGATPAGIMAALAVARAGKSVILLEPGTHLGGMVTGGLGATDTGNRLAIGGYAREFFTRIREYYVQKYGAASVQVRDCSDGFHFEPHVAMHVFRELLREARITVRLQKRLHALRQEGPRLQALTDQEGQEYRAQVFIDATYEGDLLARAGVRSTVGREASSQYGESLAGVQRFSPAHQWPVKISGLDRAGKLLPFLQPGTPGAPGAGDRKVQAYNFRLCLTQRPDLRLPFPKPANYDAGTYELLRRYLAKQPNLKVGQLMNPVRLPNGKTDTNNNGPFSTDVIGGSWSYPEATAAERAQIWRAHADYTKGFLWFLANDPAVPKQLQEEMRTWGLSKGEFEDTGHWPPQLYVREARRMLDTYIMTQADIQKNRLKDDSVGLGSYNTDSHHVQRVVDAHGFVVNEGDFQVGVQPYAIPYRSLLPRASECVNLLVPVCCSASHVAYGTIRMEPVYMILGQASGVAASLAADAHIRVQDVPVRRLQERLRAQRVVLSPAELGKRTSATAP